MEVVAIVWDSVVWGGQSCGCDGHADHSGVVNREDVWHVWVVRQRGRVGGARYATAWRGEDALAPSVVICNLE